MWAKPAVLSPPEQGKPPKLCERCGIVAANCKAITYYHFGNQRVAMSEQTDGNPTGAVYWLHSDHGAKTRGFGVIGDKHQRRNRMASEIQTVWRNTLDQRHADNESQTCPERSERVQRNEGGGDAWRNLRLQCSLWSLS
jgi:hypothetical protein